MILFLLGISLSWASVDIPQLPVNPMKEEKTIQWVVNDFPPFIVLGSEKTEVNIETAKGPIAEMYQELEKSLPQYKHRFMRVPFLRTQKLLEDKKNFCTLLLQETPERTQFLVFGEEVGRTLPAGLVVKSGVPAKYILDQGEIDLEKTIKQGGFRVGVVSGRSYTKDVDDILRRNQVNFRLIGDQAAGSLFKMLSSGRVDGVLAYFLEKANYDAGNAGTISDLKFIPIKQASPAVLLKASCVNSPWGVARLKDISTVVKQKHFKDKSLKFLLSNLPKDQKEEYLKLYKKTL